MAILINAHAQSGDIISAYNYYQDYLQYKETDQLVKAKNTIDDAIRKLMEKGEAETKNKNTGKAWYYRAQIYTSLAALKEKPELQAGAPEEAIKSYLNAIEYDDKARYDKDATNGLLLVSPSIYSAGHAAFEAKDYNKAYECFSKSVMINEVVRKKMDPKNKIDIDTLAIYAAGLAAERSGKTTEAKKYYTQLVDFKYKDAGVFMALAALHKKEGETEKANEILKKAKEMFPNSKDLVIDEINELLKAGKATEAITKMEEAIKLDPNNIGLYFALGTAHDSKGDYDKAMQNYKKCLEIDPNYFDAHYNMAAIYYNQAAEKTRKMSSLGSSKAEQKQYEELEKQSEDLFSKALPFFEKALQVNPNDINTLIALKEIAARQNNYTKVNEYKALIEKLSPKK